MHPVRKGKKSSEKSFSNAMSKEFVLSTVKDAIMQVIGSEIDDDEPLMAAGLDSLGSVEFSNVLAQKLSMQMPGTLIFDYPSIRAVSDYLTQQMPKETDARYSSDDESLSACSQSRELAAFPGDQSKATLYVKAVNVHSMMRDPIRTSSSHIVKSNGQLVDFIRTVPLSRWDLGVPADRALHAQVSILIYRDWSVH